MQIVDFDLDSPAQWFEAWHRLDVACALETLPGLEPPTAAETRGDLSSDIAYRRYGIAALDGGELVGGVALEESLLEDPDTAYGWMLVDAAHRRRGIGTRLLDAARETLRANGRRRLDTSVAVGSAASAFATSAGARVRQIEIQNVLDLDGLDLAAAKANARPRPPYAITTWTGACPDDLVASFADARTSMNDAPRGDDSYDDWMWTVERVRALERRWSELGYTTLTAAAVHEPSGAVAGYTQIILTGRPTTAIQEDTGVARAHRGHGLGRAVKSANLIALTAHSPAITTVLTWNAEPNKYMLAVNDELGFRRHSRWEEVTLTF